MINLYKKFLIETYNIGIIKKDVSNVIVSGIKKGDITWLRHDYDDRYFADPFLLKQDENNYYVLAEEYIFWEEKGKISLLTIDKKTFSLVSKRIIIEEPTHLSFPFCEENGDWVIPESVKSGKCTAYRLDKKNNDVVEKRLIANFGTVDQIVFSGLLITCTSDRPKEKLFIVSLDDAKTNINIDDKCVLQSIQYTRSAGRIFKRNEVLYRPVQDSEKGYGYQTHILKIDSLSEGKYEFERVITLDSKLNPPYTDSFHTFNVYDGFCIVDGSKNFFRLKKILYKKFRWLYGK